MIPRAFINELIARCDIAEVIDARVPLRKAGHDFTACCPFHSEKTPSFTVSPRKQFYHCFGCGVSGNVLGFLMAFERLEFVEAVEMLASHMGMVVPEELPSGGGAAPKRQQIQPNLFSALERSAKIYQTELRQSSVAIEYLKGRGLSGQICKTFGIGYAPSQWDCLLKAVGNTAETRALLLEVGMLIPREERKNSGQSYDRFRDRIMFPIRDTRGRVIGFGGRIIGDGMPKYLNSPETPLFHKGRELYGLYEAKKAHASLTSVIVVEGYMDVVALAQHGISNVVATLGTATTAEHVQRLARNTPEIIFCFDGDKAGKTAAWRALETALAVLQDGLQVKFLFLPDGEDPDSMVRKEGAEAFTARLLKATPLSEFFFGHLSAQVDLSHLDGKARFVKLAMPLIQRLPDGAFLQMMLARLAQTVRLDESSVRTLAARPQENIVRRGQQQSSDNGRRERASSTGRQSPMRMAIALLVQHPELVATLTQDRIDALSNFVLPGGPLLKEIVQLLQQYPEMKTGALLEHWRDRKEGVLLTKLAALQHPLPETAMPTEFAGFLDRLLGQQHEQGINALLQKAQQQGLSAEERVTLQNLLTQEPPTLAS